MVNCVERKRCVEFLASGSAPHAETCWQQFEQFLNDFLSDFLDDFLYENLNFLYKHLRLKFE